MTLEEKFQNIIAVSYLGLLWLFLLHLLQTKRLIEGFSFEHIVLLSLHSIWHNGRAEQMIGVSSSSATSRSCDASLKWPISHLSSLFPRKLPLSGSPAGRKDPLPSLEWLLLGLVSRWRERQGRERGGGGGGGWGCGGVTQTWRTRAVPTLPITLHPIPDCYLPFLLTLPPHRQALSLLFVCVYAFMHFYSSGCMCDKATASLCVRLCFHTDVLAWLC